MPRVTLQTARSSKADPAAIADDLMRQLGPGTGKLAMMYAARSHDHHALNEAVRQRLPRSVRLVGASTAGELDREGMHDGSVVLGLLGGDLEVGIGVGKDLTRDGVTAGMDAAKMATSELGARPSELEGRQFVGVAIDDGLRDMKEHFLLGLMDRNQGLVVVGGGAADPSAFTNLKTATSVLHVDGEVLSDAALFVLFKTEAPWAALRSHWYLPTGTTMTITKVDDTHRRALEIDGQPAARRYAELLGVEIDELPYGAPRGFAASPLALRVGSEYFIRAPLFPFEDGSISFANLLEEDSELELMRLGDPVGETARFFGEVLPAAVKSPSAALLFDCGGRKRFAEVLGKSAELSNAYRGAPPSIGFSVHFEVYCGLHLNTTLTCLAFGDG